MRLLTVAAQAVALAIQGAPELWPLVPHRYHQTFHGVVLAGQGFVGAAYFVHRKFKRRGRR